MTTAPVSIPFSDTEVSQLSSDLKNAIKQVKDIQVLVTQFIDTVIMRKNDEADKEIHTLKDTMKKLSSARSELEKIIKASNNSNLRLNNIHPVPLGNNGYISLDPIEDRNNFYQELLESYAWLNNINRDATELCNEYKRKCDHEDGGSSAKYQKSIENLLSIINYLKSSFPMLTINDRFLLNQSYLEIKVASSFVCYLFFSGSSPSFITVKDMDEMYELEPSENSKRYVFQRFTYVLVTAILKLSREKPEIMLRNFLSFLCGFRNLFSKKCGKCNKYLSIDSETHHLLPPIWRSLESKDEIVYHINCKS